MPVLAYIASRIHPQLWHNCQVRNRREGPAWFAHLIEILENGVDGLEGQPDATWLLVALVHARIPGNRQARTRSASQHADWPQAYSILSTMICGCCCLPMLLRAGMVIQHDLSAC